VVLLFLAYGIYEAGFRSAGRAIASEFVGDELYASAMEQSQAGPVGEGSVPHRISDASRSLGGWIFLKPCRLNSIYELGDQNTNRSFVGSDAGFRVLAAAFSLDGFYLIWKECIV
jgi:hypothetical protein